jgi:hypothetical protein
MTALLPFFIKAQLPYSIVRNEIAVVQANIFNKLDKDYNVGLSSSNIFVHYLKNSKILFATDATFF